MPPLAVRVQVIRRMLVERKSWPAGNKESAIWVFDHLGSHTKRIEIGLKLLGLDGAHLDHNPALILRPYNPRIKDIAARYTPHAHDPDALEYLVKSAHGHKTFGRKPGAERTVTTKGSDIWLKAKFARLEGKTKQRPKVKIAQRKNPWPKRKMR